MRSDSILLSSVTLISSLLGTSAKTIGAAPDIPLNVPIEATAPIKQSGLRSTRAQHDHDQITNKVESSASTSSSTFTSEQAEEGGRNRVPRKTEAEKHEFQKLRDERMRQRREQAKETIKEHQPNAGNLQRLSAEEIQQLYGKAVKSDPLLEKEDHKWMRGINRNLSSDQYLADPGVEYDSWAQGYRMLGGFIDCDNDKDGNSGDNGNNNACSRWMMWAAYINPNYQNGGRNEYFYYDSYGSETTSSSLDCHSSNTEWQLLGVYREEFYQFIEQISKHLWAIDEYEYVYALAGLAYMTDDDCFGVGFDSSGNYLYAGVQPTYGGNFQMSLYSDNQCLNVDTSSGLTYDDFGQNSDMDLGSKDDGSMSDDEVNTLSAVWQNAQEYTLSLVNEVYEDFKYCTLCMDYPTYQDGYFIGDDGTDDDDLINQCWKFHSHDSYICDASCIAKGEKQGTITRINYLGKTFGQPWDGSSGGSSSSSSSGSGYKSSSGGGGNSQGGFAKFKANAFLVFNGVVFIATFLAFSVARGTRDSVDSSDKKRSLLSREERRAAKSPKSANSRRSSKSAKSRRGGKSVTSKSSKASKSTPRSTSNVRSSSKARSSSNARSGRSASNARSSSNRSKSRQRSSSKGKRNGTYA
jgi:uncharacterized membrane protein YgcG